MDMRYEADRMAMLLRRGYPADAILQDRKMSPREKRQVRKAAEKIVRERCA